MHWNMISLIRYIGICLFTSFVSFVQFSWSPHVIYCCTYLLQLFSYARKHDKLDQVYFVTGFFHLICSFYVVFMVASYKIVKCVSFAGVFLYAGA